MAAYPIVVVDDALLKKLPEEFRDDPRYQCGSSLELVPVAEATMPSLSYERKIESWRDLEGILADSSFDPNAELEAEKQRELQSEGR